MSRTTKKPVKRRSCRCGWCLQVTKKKLLEELSKKEITDHERDCLMSIGKATYILHPDGTQGTYYTLGSTITTSVADVESYNTQFKLKGWKLQLVTTGPKGFNTYTVVVGP